ncbi:MAG TPA: hypothetical protein VMY18_01420, partial [Acidobacteriota bacterium]|nr:hypothetical protein [Acidobacteriota bacterium]
LVWRTNIQYHLIVNDWLGRIAYYLRSKDRINWKVEPGEAYLPGIATYEDGTKVNWFKYERIKVLQDEYGRAAQAHFAVIDVLKRKDMGSDNHSSKHICIPLTVGRLLTILDGQQFTVETKTIRVKIAAEDDLDPHTAIDVDSLRFGASEEVNFGRGSRAIGTERSGDDLIVTFDGAGNGIDENNFAAKLLGKTRSGKLLFGYARLPWVSYVEPALSALPPRITKSDEGFKIAVEVQNFGQVPSTPTMLEITSRNSDQFVEIALASLPVLDAFQKTVIELTCGKLFKTGLSYDIGVIINPDGPSPVTLQRSLIPAPSE